MEDAILVGFVGLVSNVLGSLAALAIWFHYDLDGWWEQKRIQRGRRMEEKAKSRTYRTY